MIGDPRHGEPAPEGSEPGGWARDGWARDGWARDGWERDGWERGGWELGDPGPDEAASAALASPSIAPAEAALDGPVDGPLLGVDAGGTDCRSVLVLGGEIVERRRLGPLNVLLHADALDRLAELIRASGAVAAGLGLAGVRTAADAHRLAAELGRRTGVPIVVGDDTEAALAGAFRGGPGLVVIAGTGSGALGRNAEGQAARVGGHGFLLGDEGGGYWIGREAARAALRAADGTGPPTALGGMVRAEFGDLAAAVREVHARPTDRRLLSRLVPAVAALAEGAEPYAGPDAEASRIMAEAADHLIGLAEAIQDRLGALPVAMAGGVFQAAPVRRRFAEATGAVAPAEPADIGAIRLLGALG
jgi:N-acetylglucosamine kinase-like BadF-type ATPase